MNKLAQNIEAILFVASSPISLKLLSELTQKDLSAIETSLNELELSLATTGLRLSRHSSGIRLVTAPDATAVVQQFLQQEAKTELSKPALETLSIIAYKGPISRTEIETIRGVGSEATLRSLLSRGLVTTAGTAAVPGRPPLYAVSPEFLDLFGLTHTDQLPTLDGPHAS